MQRQGRLLSSLLSMSRHLAVLCAPLTSALPSAASFLGSACTGDAYTLEVDELPQGMGLVLWDQPGDRISVLDSEPRFTVQANETAMLWAVHLEALRDVAACQRNHDRMNCFGAGLADWFRSNAAACDGGWLSPLTSPPRRSCAAEISVTTPSKLCHIYARGYWASLQHASSRLVNTRLTALAAEGSPFDFMGPLMMFSLVTLACCMGPGRCPGCCHCCQRQNAYPMMPDMPMRPRVHS